jgi:putative peptidoglycan lipid II flippase
LPLGVLGIALGTVLLPEMSARLARSDPSGADAAQNNSAALTLLLTLPFAIVFLTIPGTIMRAIFAHGAFDAQAASLSGVALAAYGVGLPAFALVRIVASTFYARHDTATPARVTLIAFAANIAVKLVLVLGFHLGIAGIALGTAFGAWLNVAQLVWLGRRRSLLTVSDGFRRALGPILLASVVAGVGATSGTWAASYLHVSGLWHDLVALSLAGLFGIGGYLAVVFAFRRSLPLGRFGAGA